MATPTKRIDLENNIEQMLVQSYLALLNFDPIECLDKHNQPKELQRLTADQRRMISGMEIEELYGWDNRRKVAIGRKFKYKFLDRGTPLLRIGRIAEQIQAEKHTRKEVEAPVTREEKEQGLVEALIAAGLDLNKLKEIIG